MDENDQIWMMAVKYIVSSIFATSWSAQSADARRDGAFYGQQTLFVFDEPT